MIGLLERIRKFINYWYVRYLVVTELYMVESWERAVIHILFSVLFIAFWYFNSTVVVRTIAGFRGFPHSKLDVS